MNEQRKQQLIVGGVFLVAMLAILISLLIDRIKEGPSWEPGRRMVATTTTQLSVDLKTPAATIYPGQEVAVVSDLMKDWEEGPRIQVRIVEPPDEGTVGYVDPNDFKDK